MIKLFRIITYFKMNIIDAINNSFLLDSSQKIYLIKKLENSNEEYKNNLLKILNSEKAFITQLLRKYKDDSSNISIWQLKGELMRKNFEKIKVLEKNDNDDIALLEKSLEEI